MNFINPYSLLGVNPNMPDLKQLKQSYYRLALLCHPDKGGNKESMDIVHKSYLYIKNQFDNCQNIKTYEELEEEFETFCKTQEAIPPPFREIWENSEDYNNLKKFNEEFEKKQANYFKKIEQTNHFMKSFNEGYGKFMDISEYKNNSDVLNATKKSEQLNETFNNHSFILDKKNKHKFKSDLIVYKEPNNVPLGYGQHLRFDVNIVDDFTDKLNFSNINMNDYKKAFTEETEKLNFEDIIKNRPKSLDELKKNRENVN